MNIPNSDFLGTVVLWHDAIEKDDQLTCLIAKIQSEQYQLHIVGSEYQAIRSIVEKRASLLIIHLRSAGNTGYDLCEIFRTQATGQYLPIVFLGSRGEACERMKVLRCGGSDYLGLPMHAEESWLRLNQHLGISRRINQLETDKLHLSQKVNEYSQVLKQQEQLKLSLAEENQALHRLAYVDGLTQVANRRSFNQSISQFWREAAAKRQPLSLLLCDIDYFKRYNDTYGHLEGDRCLQTVAAALLRGASRFQDFVARYGGEEFAILLPDTSLEGARQVADNVQSEMLQIQIPHEGSLVAPWVTLSIGVCTITPTTGEQPYESLIHCSDEAMYTAKIRGRNRSVVNTLTELISIERNYCLCDYKTGVEDLKKYWRPNPHQPSLKRESSAASKVSSAASNWRSADRVTDSPADAVELQLSRSRLPRLLARNSAELAKSTRLKRR